MHLNAKRKTVLLPIAIKKPAQAAVDFAASTPYSLRLYRCIHLSSFFTEMEELQSVRHIQLLTLGLQIWGDTVVVTLLCRYSLLTLNLWLLREKMENVTQLNKKIFKCFLYTITFCDILAIRNSLNWL